MFQLVVTSFFCWKSKFIFGYEHFSPNKKLRVSWQNLLNAKIWENNFFGLCLWCDPNACPLKLRFGHIEWNIMLCDQNFPNAHIVMFPFSRQLEENTFKTYILRLFVKFTLYFTLFDKKLQKKKTFFRIFWTKFKLKLKLDLSLCFILKLKPEPIFCLEEFKKRYQKMFFFFANSYRTVWNTMWN